MRELAREVAQMVGLLVSLIALAVGLIMVHPGLALAVAGLVGTAGMILWIRNSRPTPGLPGPPEEAGQQSPGEYDPDDDGRMEVRPL